MLQPGEEPGDRSPAPGPLRLVQLFVNTNDLETGPDLLPDAAALRGWMNERGLLDAAEPSHRRGPRARDRAPRGDPRAGVRPRRPPPRPEGRRRRQRRPRCAPACARCSTTPVTRLEPSAGGVDGALGRIVAAIHAGVADGTWERLKACERDICRWAFYDHSKNRSGHWCSMAVCGQREKNRRAYRRRRARAEA